MAIVSGEDGMMPLEEYRHLEVRTEWQAVGALALIVGGIAFAGFLGMQNGISIGEAPTFDVSSNHQTLATGE